MNSPATASIASLITITSMVAALSLGVSTHVMRSDLDPIAMPFSAYLSGKSRRIGLACYSCLVMGIGAFAIAATFRPGLDFETGAASTLLVVSMVLVAIAGATARADAPLTIDEPRSRLLHRWSAFFAFLSAILAIALDTYAWRAQLVLHAVGNWIAGLAGTLIVLFVVLSFVSSAFKGAVQKMLMLGIVVWFISVAAAMRY